MGIGWEVEGRIKQCEYGGIEVLLVRPATSLGV